MGWKDIRKRTVVPILTPDGISKMIESCLKKEGRNTTHSRTITMNGYKEPINDEKSVSETEIEKIKFDIVRYMAQSILRDCDASDLTKTISDFIPKWDKKNDLTVAELQEIVAKTDAQMKELIEDKTIKTNIGNFIKNVYITSCDLKEEHNGENPIYPFEKTMNNEKNTLWGYNKRIYLNPSLKNISTYKFLAEYIKKCIDRRIPFDMKGLGSTTHSETELDGMILYSSNKYFNSHLECLEEVIRENPDLMSTFGTPIYTGAMVKDTNDRPYYTIGAGFPCEYKVCTYNDYIDSSINLTYLISSAKLIKQYLPLVLAQYRELDADTKLLINKLNNLEQCSAEELQKIEAKIEAGDPILKEQKRIIREMSYKIISHKKEQGTKQEQQEVMGKLRTTFSNSFKMVCSALKFKDKDHIQTPIYQDESFIDFEKTISAKDIAEADSQQQLTMTEMENAHQVLHTMEKLTKEKEGKEEK